MERSPNPFSTDPSGYAASRPGYPTDLIEWIVGHCSDREAAWDCATGNGQAAIDLADHFREVQASDVSAEQLAAAFAHPRVTYSVQPAERTEFADASFDLISVAQALHWFDLDRFWPEVKRVARPDCFFCAWGYSWFEPDPELDDLYMQPLLALLMPLFAPQNRLLWNGYRDEDIKFPFERLRPPPFSLNLDWSVEQLIGYVRTWSAYKTASADQRLRIELGSLEDGLRRHLANRARLSLEMRIKVAAARVA